MGISLSGGSASKYFISANNLELGPGEAGSFIIEPFSMPEAGTYTETVTLSNGGAVNENFDVSLTVKPKAIPICEVLPLDENDAYIFPPSVVGYAPKTTKEVTVRNWGSANTGKLDITLSGRNAESFELNKSSISNLGKGDADTFTVVPKTGLAVGTYRAKLTVSGGPEIESRSFYVSFTVEAAKTYRISLSKSGTYDFGTEIKGTYPQSVNVGVTNTGTEETGALTLALSGADAASFELTKESLPSMEIGGFDSFMDGEKIRPDNPPVVHIGLADSTDFTERELEVLRLLAERLSDKEIAEKLNKSLNTVRYHVGNLISKTGASSRTELAVSAVQSGITIPGFR